MPKKQELKPEPKGNTEPIRQPVEAAPPVPKEYPRFITHAGLAVVVQSEAEEEALEDGRAFVHVTKSAEGDITSVEYKPK
jgi:hypothetical protein